jgi:hypothetical protein
MHVPDLYARQDPFTDPGDLVHLDDDLPDTPARLRDLVSQLVTHVSWAARYGIPADVPMPRETHRIADRLRMTRAWARRGPRTVVRPDERLPWQDSP